MALQHESSSGLGVGFTLLPVEWRQHSPTLHLLGIGKGKGHSIIITGEQVSSKQVGSEQVSSKKSAANKSRQWIYASTAAVAR
jgi:hypothetical protein